MTETNKMTDEEYFALGQNAKFCTAQTSYIADNLQKRKGKDGEVLDIGSAYIAAAIIQDTAWKMFAAGKRAEYKPQSQ